MLIGSFIACEEDEISADLKNGLIVYMAPPDNCNDFIIVVDDLSQTMLKPNNLAESFKIDSLKVKFDFDSTNRSHNCNFGGQIPVVSINQLEIAQDESCHKKARLSSEEYTSGETASYTIQSASISGDCFQVIFSSSGCNGLSWKSTLVDSEAILESAPAQRNVKFLLENNEACQAVFTRSAYFDLTALQINTEREILLRIDGLEEKFLYSY